MSFLDEPGDLAEVPLAAVLIEVLNQRATGALTVEHDGGASRVFVRAGVPVGAQSFKGFRPLGKVLLSASLIDMDVLGRSLAEMARTGKQQGDVLVEMGAVTREQVDRALSEQQAAYLTQIAGLASGRFRFEASDSVPPWTQSIRIAPLKAIVEALERPQAMPLVFSALQPAADRAIALAPGYRQLADAFGWSADEGALVDRLQSLVTLDVFLAEPRLPPERARAIIAALLLLGLATPHQAAGAVEAVPGIVVDLADLAGVPIEPEPPPAPPPAVRVAPAEAPAPAAAPRPTRRSDPEEARRRRQRLLQRAMQNMGVGPLSGQRPAGADAPRPAPAAAPAAPPKAQEVPPSRAAPSGEEELRRALAAAVPRARSADLFERLGLTRAAARDQVKAAYFQIAKQLHPDRFASPSLSDVADQVRDMFAAVNEAYEVLSDDRKRAEYLARGARGPAQGGGDDRQGAVVEFQKAEACARTRDWAKARGFFEAALRADQRPEWQLAYATMLLQDPAGDRARARTLLDHAMRDPGCLEKAAWLAAVLARGARDDDQAEKLLRRVLQANPRHAEAERELKAIEARRAKARGGGGLGGLFRRK